ncbi:MAG: helix-turn-helix transcriptional regulator [Clostridia bacterium]|nr:helix-turn-helix transcriptional regulator [Clostridia bacterium]
MTLGQKLAGYRKLSGMTQQQLGEHLNISAQAISKWEKDLSEPALATLRTLAELYKVSVDELLDLENGFADMSVLANDEEGDDTAKESAPAAIGFCKSCGINVTEENLGTTDPVVLCKSCLAKKQEQERQEAEKKRRQQEEEARAYRIQKEFNQRKRRNHRTLSFCIAGIAAAIFVGVMIACMVTNFNAALIPVALVGTYVVFAFVSSLFYDCFVQEVVWDWFDKSIHLPGLIFTFDLDGIIWLIGMKILFFIIGLIFGIITGTIGIIIGLACAPFVFPYVMHKEARGIAAGEALED